LEPRRCTVTVRRWGRSQVAELQRGYTTTTFTMGRFWYASTPDGPVTNGWVQWDWEATWVLRPDGQVAVTNGQTPEGEASMRPTTTSSVRVILGPLESREGKCAGEPG
jgi:hypothetical protein